MTCIWTLNLRIARQRLGLRQSSGAFGGHVSNAKASKDWRGFQRFMESLHVRPTPHHHAGETPVLPGHVHGKA